MDDHYHETVLVEEVVEVLHLKKSCKYIDGTLGNGGHTLEILKSGGEVLGIDLDPEMLKVSEERIKKEFPMGGNYKLVLGNFKDIKNIAAENNWDDVQGVLLDLGVSNIHLKDLERGFSFENEEAELDMRLDPNTQGVKACDLLNVLRADQLESMFAVTMEGGSARWMTKRVVGARDLKSFKTVGDFLEVCRGLKTGKPGLNAATLPFLALRIAVNSELDNLQDGLKGAFEILKSGGRLAVISFHSKEDEIVKDFFKDKRQSGLADLVTFKPVEAGQNELQINRRARSAKMRVIQKV